MLAWCECFSTEQHDLVFNVFHAVCFYHMVYCDKRGLKLPMNKHYNPPTAHTDRELCNASKQTDRCVCAIWWIVSGSGRLKVSGRKTQSTTLSSDKALTVIQGRNWENTAGDKKTDRISRFLLSRFASLIIKWIQITKQQIKPMTYMVIFN